MAVSPSGGPPDSGEELKRHCWSGEAWSRDDGLLLNLPVFQGCSPEFKRRLLREVRIFELEAKGQETWWDREHDVICTLDTLAEDRLPPLRMESIGQLLVPGEYVCRGGDYDTKLVVVLSGSVEKLIGDASSSGRCIVRTLTRGDSEGITEFLGVGSEQRTCALRAGRDGAKIRYVTKEAILKLLGQTESGEAADYVDPAAEFWDEGERDPPIPPEMRWLAEIDYFRTLALDRIDSLHHREAKRLLSWSAAADDHPLNFLDLEQDLFMIDNALGTCVSGPLPEGIEERYFFSGQTVIRNEVAGDSLIMVLRGELEADVPQGCGGQCLLRAHTPDKNKCGSWIGDGRAEPLLNELELEANKEIECSEQGIKSMSSIDAAESTQAQLHRQQLSQTGTGRRHIVTETEKLLQQVAIVTLAPPEKLKKAIGLLQSAEKLGRLDLSKQTSKDYRWSWDDPQVLVVFEILSNAGCLSKLGQQKAEAVRGYQVPPSPPPPCLPQAVLSSGAMIGHLTLLGVPEVLAGTVRARGPVLIVILHRHVLLEALRLAPEREFFVPRGVTPRDWVQTLITPPKQPDQEERPAHLGPRTGPPVRRPEQGAQAPSLAGTFGTFCSDVGDYARLSGADALDYALLNALRNYNLIWELICDAPPRLLEAFVQQFEPRWLLPGEKIIIDEEPDANFLFVVVHGELIITLEGAEIGRMRQGDVQGAAQLLNVIDWTRTVTVDAHLRSEAMIQVIRREQLLDILAGHPVPKGRMRDIEEELRVAKGADWRILQNIPAFGGSCSRAFLARVFKDADVILRCPKDLLAEVGQPSSCMLVVLAGKLRSERPQTLFHVDLARGDWCFQNCILGNEPNCSHDVVAVTHCMVLVLYRHALLNAVVAFPEARELVLESETWRKTSPPINSLRVLEGVPAPILARLEKEAGHSYYREGSYILAPGTTVDEGTLLFLLRGEARVLILDTEIAILHAGNTIGTHRFLKLPVVTNQRYEVIANAPTDALILHSDVLFAAMKDDRYEDNMKHFENASRVLAGGDILDAFGFKVEGADATFNTDCIETSDVLKACSRHFVAQLPALVEDVAFWPGEKIYNQGDEGDFMYFVQAGRVRLEALGRIQHEVKTGGDTIGDMACLEQVAGHTETAVAETHVWLRALHRKLLRRALQAFPEEERSLLGSDSKDAGGIFEGG